MERNSYIEQETILQFDLHLCNVPKMSQHFPIPKNKRVAEIKQTHKQL